MILVYFELFETKFRVFSENKYYEEITERYHKFDI